MKLLTRRTRSRRRPEARLAFASFPVVRRQKIRHWCDRHRDQDRQYLLLHRTGLILRPRSARQWPPTTRWSTIRAGWNGRKIVFLSYDDAYSPPEDRRGRPGRLVEQGWHIARLPARWARPTNSADILAVHEPKKKRVPHPLLSRPAPPNGMTRRAIPGRSGWQPQLPERGPASTPPSS